MFAQLKQILERGQDLVNNKKNDEAYIPSRSPNLSGKSQRSAPRKPSSKVSYRRTNSGIGKSERSATRIPQNGSIRIVLSSKRMSVMNDVEQLNLNNTDDEMPVGTINIDARATIYDFLSVHVDDIDSDTTKLTEFEAVVRTALIDATQDFALIAVLHSAGWVMGRFCASPTEALDANSLFINLTNLYIQSNLYQSVRTLNNTSRRTSGMHSSRRASNSGGMLSSRRVDSIKDSNKTPRLTPALGAMVGTSSNRKTSYQPMLSPLICAEEAGEDGLADGEEEDEEYYNEEDEEGNDSIQILSFCPNLLIKHLESRVDAGT